MRLFGFEITRKKTLSSVAENRGGWWPVVRESFAGAWQQNVVVDQNLALSYHAVFSCITLIASDIAKLRVKLVELTAGPNGIWTETSNPAYSPVLRKPNLYQNRIQFWESWIISKLTAGNTYALKQRDGRGVVVRLYILDPRRTRPLVADDGSVFYELNADNLSGLPEGLIVPAREIIHDRMNCLFHPLVGVSPLYAAGLPATQGLNIQNNSAWFFKNKSSPGGVLTAPGHIPDDTATRLKAYWDENFSGENRGKVAVLGDGLKFEAMAVSPVDAQLIEQLKMTAEMVCTTFHVPPYKIGLGAMPTNNNVQALNVEYYSQCLQSLIEAAELCLDEGLDVGERLGVEFDLDGLLRMDTQTQINTLKEAVGAALMAPDEARRKLDLPPVKGGSSPYLQEQNFSLAALAKRDALDDPWASRSSSKPAVTPPTAPSPAEPESDDETEEAKSFGLFSIALKEAA